jgi:hypothetical protein
MQSSSKNVGWLEKLAGILAVIVAALIGWYAGLSLLIPAGFAILVYTLAKRFVLGARKIVLSAFSIQVGALGWYCFATDLDGPV